MSNKALIMGLGSDGELDELAIYLHWYGNSNQVKAFLAYCKMMKYRSLENDWYGWGQLAKTIGNFIDENKKSDGLSFGICSVSHTWRGLNQKPGALTKDFLYHSCPGENGIYIVSDWKVILHYGQNEEKMTPNILRDLLVEINQYQPYHLSKKTIEEFVEKEADNYI